MTRNATTKPAAPALPLDTPFETAIAELEDIVQNMENGRLSLEESILAYRRGSELFQHCQKQLGEAEYKIRIFENERLHDANLAGETGR
jgi:exodeoxyribonuclease VII small subunit